MMQLGAVIIVSILVLIWLRRRDDRYLQSQLEDVVSEDIKKYINSPEQSEFTQDLRAASDSQASLELLKKMNEIE